jgi:hypothetical protein
MALRLNLEIIDSMKMVRSPKTRTIEVVDAVRLNPKIIDGMGRARSPESRNHRHHGKGAFVLGLKYKHRGYCARPRLKSEIINNMETALCLNLKIIGAMDIVPVRDSNPKS